MQVRDVLERQVEPALPWGDPHHPRAPVEERLLYYWCGSFFSKDLQEIDDVWWKIRSRKLKLFIMDFKFLSMGRSSKYAFAFSAAGEPSIKSFCFWDLADLRLLGFLHLFGRCCNSFLLWIRLGYWFLVERGPITGVSPSCSSSSSACSNCTVGYIFLDSHEWVRTLDWDGISYLRHIFVLARHKCKPFPRSLFPL